MKSEKVTREDIARRYQARHKGIELPPEEKVRRYYQCLLLHEIRKMIVASLERQGLAKYKRSDDYHGRVSPQRLAWSIGGQLRTHGWDVTKTIELINEDAE